MTFFLKTRICSFCASLGCDVLNHASSLYWLCVKVSIYFRIYRGSVKQSLNTSWFGKHSAATLLQIFAPALKRPIRLQPNRESKWENWNWKLSLYKCDRQLFMLQQRVFQKMPFPCQKMSLVLLSRANHSQQIEHQILQDASGMLLG